MSSQTNVVALAETLQLAPFALIILDSRTFVQLDLSLLAINDDAERGKFGFLFTISRNDSDTMTMETHFDSVHLSFDEFLCVQEMRA